MDFKNKVVVITGGTKGLGKALAFSFLKENAQIVVCARNKEEFKDLPQEILCIKADVTKEEELIDLVEIVKQKFGQLDVWINNAGMWLPHASVEAADWGKV